MIELTFVALNVATVAAEKDMPPMDTNNAPPPDDAPELASDIRAGGRGVSEITERCAGVINSENLEFCIMVQSNEETNNAAGIIQAIEKFCTGAHNAEEMANCIGAK